MATVIDINQHRRHDPRRLPVPIGSPVSPTALLPWSDPLIGHTLLQGAIMVAWAWWLAPLGLRVERITKKD